MTDKAVYIRVSTGEQTAESQLPNIETMSGKDYKLYIDKTSAWKDTVKRVQFDKLQADIRAGRIKDVYVWDLDRLYRNRRKCLDTLRGWVRIGCKFHSYRQAFLEDLNKMPAPWNEMVSDMLLHMLAWNAQEESEKKSDRVKIAHKQFGKEVKWGRHPIDCSCGTLDKNGKKHNGQGINIDQALLDIAEGLSFRDVGKKHNISLGSLTRAYRKGNPILSKEIGA